MKSNIIKSMNNEKLNSLICQWLELNLKKLHAIENQHYEKAAYARDEERQIEYKICDIANLDTDSSSSAEIRKVVTQYLSECGINIHDINKDNVKQSIREIKLKQIGIK